MQQSLLSYYHIFFTRRHIPNLEAETAAEDQNDRQFNERRKRITASNITMLCKAKQTSGIFLHFAKTY